MKKEQIIEAARKLFYQFGFKKVSMDEIAREAGVTKKTIYRLLQYRKEKNFLNIIAREAEWLKNPVIIENLKLIDEQIQNYIRTKLELAKEKGYIEYENLDITAFLIYKMYLALIFEWDDTKNEIDEQMIAKTISKILKNGLIK